MSCLGRERMFEHFSRAHGTKVSLIRLNYACELRYGVLVDLARKVWDGRAVDLAMGNFNAIWQADANAVSLRSLEGASSPPLVLERGGPGNAERPAGVRAVRHAVRQAGRRLRGRSRRTRC